MRTIPTRTLPNGDDIPVVGLGTANLHGDIVSRTVRSALDLGYTHIDTAEGYGNERAIGNALSEFDRDDLFLTSKVSPTNLHYENVIRSCRASLDRLDTSYFDLYLIHWPNPAISLRETLHAMEHLYEQGMIRNVGVSNFDAYLLRFAHRLTEFPIAVNQIEYNPWWQPERTLEYCSKNDVLVSAASPLGQTAPFDDPVIQELAESHGKEPAQILLRWLHQKGLISIPRSTARDHLESNLRIFDWALTDGDVDRIDSIERAEKTYDIEFEEYLY